MKNSLRWCTPVLLFVIVAHSQSISGQGSNAHHDYPSAEHNDVLGRSTPRGTVLGFLHAAKNGEYREASQYLQLSQDDRVSQGDRLTSQLHALMDHAFVGRVGPVSDNPDGSGETGGSRNRERIGEFRIDDGTANVELVRVSGTDDNEIWLFSSETLAAVPDFYNQLEISKVDSWLPRFLVTDRLLSTPLWRWIAFLILIPVAYGLAWIVVRAVRAGLQIWSRWRDQTVLQNVHSSIAAPATLILTAVFHQIGVMLLGQPLLFRMYYHRIAGVVIVAATTWLVFRLVNRWGERTRGSAHTRSGYHSGAIVLLGQRLLKLMAVVVSIFVVFSIFGFNMTTVIAGIGVSGAVVALAAQRTLENLFGGISILGDEVIRVGEVCRIEGRVGFVEDISLRSTRIRTLECTELSVPNGELASKNVENLSRRDRWLFEAVIGLRSNTTPDQLCSLLTAIREMLDAHQQVDMDPSLSSVRLIGFGESSIEIEISCHLLTKKLTMFRALREEILLSVMRLITEIGTELATPARELHLAQDQEEVHRRIQLNGGKSDSGDQGRRAA